LNIEISQASVVTDLRWGGRIYSRHSSLFRRPQFILQCKNERIDKIITFAKVISVNTNYVAAKATYIRLLFGKMGVFRP